jgi:fructose-1,6-bisphosphatase/sedoheptulose 1,7-bisphosphatase-like protein
MYQTKKSKIMAEILSLGPTSPADGKPVARVVEILEDYLAAAKRGDIRAVTLAAVVPNGIQTEYTSGTADRHLLIAALKILDCRMMAHLTVHEGFTQEVQ